MRSRIAARVKSIPYRNPAGERAYRHEWLCPTCEYVAEFPDAPVVPTVPRERAPKPLQSVELFPTAQYTREAASSREGKAV